MKEIMSMNVSAQNVINTFEQLPEAEQKTVITELLKRIVKSNSLPLSDEELVLNAEELFLELDKREKEDAQS
jgi:hypothetical protein